MPSGALDDARKQLGVDGGADPVDALDLARVGG